MSLKRHRVGWTESIELPPRTVNGCRFNREILMFVFSFQCVLCQYHQFQKWDLLLNLQQLFSKFTLYKCWWLVLCPPYSACSQWLASQSFTHPSYFIEICTRIKRTEYQAVRSQITMCNWELLRREVRGLCQHTVCPLFILFSLTNFKSWTCFWEGIQALCQHTGSPLFILFLWPTPIPAHIGSV